MLETLKPILEKWKKLDKKSKIIYGAIAVILIIGLIISFSAGGDGRTVSDTDIDLSNSDNAIVITSDTDTSGEGYDAAMSSTDADAGGDNDVEDSSETTTATTTTKATTTTTTAKYAGAKVEYGEDYNSRDEVAAYIAAYGELPPNYITKNEAYDLGWKDEYSTVAQAAPGMSIGGDKFGNYEGILPKKKGRQYYECDIDYKKGNRNAKRIVFSNDGLIFYTDDHYESFIEYDPETGKWK